MRGVFQYIAIVGFALVLPFTLGQSCSSTTVRGGGWIPSACDAKKATFGFQVDCDVATQIVSGSLNYNDHGCNVRLKAEAEWVAPSAVLGCVEAGTAGSYLGTYYTDPETGLEGMVQVAFNGDDVTIDVMGGPHDLYHNQGTIRGGNIGFEK